MTQEEKILNLFYDNEWVTVQKMHEVSWRYGAHLHRLRKKGFTFEKRKQTDSRLEEWKLIDEPNNQKQLFYVEPDSFAKEMKRIN